MSIFKNLFTKQDDEFTDFNWIPLIDESQLDDLLLESQTKTVFIFKHSTRCGISSSVLRRFEKNKEQAQNETYYYLDLLRFRNISILIESKFEITHQSPQLIVLKSNKVIHHASHHQILDYN